MGNYKGRNGILCLLFWPAIAVPYLKTYIENESDHSLPVSCARFVPYCVEGEGDGEL